jgi:hypothetical protein
VGAQAGRFAPVAVGDREAHGAGAGGDQNQGADPVRPARGVHHGEVGRRGVGEDIDAVESEVYAQGFDVVDLPVAAVGGGVDGRGGRAGAPGVEHDQPPVPGQPAEVPQVGGGAHGPARQADQRIALPLGAVGQFGPVVRQEGRNAAIFGGGPAGRNVCCGATCHAIESRVLSLGDRAPRSMALMVARGTFEA